MLESFGGFGNFAMLVTLDPKVYSRQGAKLETFSFATFATYWGNKGSGALPAVTTSEQRSEDACLISL
jgi:hypothetical protein